MLAFSSLSLFENKNQKVFGDLLSIKNFKSVNKNEKLRDSYGYEGEPFMNLSF